MRVVGAPSDSDGPHVVATAQQLYGRFDRVLTGGDAARGGW